jgi:hypothetical protein
VIEQDERQCASGDRKEAVAGAVQQRKGASIFFETPLESLAMKESGMIRQAIILSATGSIVSIR